MPEQGDKATPGDAGTPEPAFGSAEWLLAQLNGGRTPAAAPRSPLLLPPTEPAEPTASAEVAEP
ncbi:MAG TPA: hypothetical protein VIP54_08310, partial [Microterricola sp.]